MDLPDLSSLHCAIADDTCNIHIDEMGFVMTGRNGDVVVDPDFLRHTLVELLWKTKLKGKIPLWALDRFSFVIPKQTTDHQWRRVPSRLTGPQFNTVAGSFGV